MQRMWSTYLDSDPGHGGEGQVMASARRMDPTIHRRTPSVISHAHSMASSQQHMLASNTVMSHANKSYMSLNPSSANHDDLVGPMTTSLSVNYLPSKFSGLNSGGLLKRKGGSIRKQGGGREAFKRSESRMPGANDDDYDGVDVRKSWFGAPGDGGRTRLRWNKFKWTLFVANFLLTLYSITPFIFCLLTWFNVWHHADIVRVGNRTQLIISTIAGAIGMFTSLVGWSGILLNNRSFLAIYNLMLWITFVFIAAPGYMTYKQRKFNLEGKINAQWSSMLGLEGRLRIQSALNCCGYFSPFVEATVSNTCYARSVLPGCKNGYMKFENKVLGRWYIVAFSLVAVHICAMLASLLCSNHVTYRFGKGMMPKAYRLSMNSMAVIIDSYASQLTEQYGAETAAELMNRSKSTLNFQMDSFPAVPYSPYPPGYSPSGGVSRKVGHAQYQSVGGGKKK